MPSTTQSPVELQRLRMMMRIRRFEERVYVEYTKPWMGIRGFVHLACGQEAIAVGVAEVHQRGRDYLIANVRHHAHSLALGMEPAAAMAELFGYESGCCKGRGGSMHFFNATSLPIPTASAATSCPMPCAIAPTPN
ncbi:MAG TPA: thiamine pyrophosphate-dependent enzyme [Tepidisphaeraceae bacterium]|nr:thiamine pyrophosphate-dependent enzyme [Tepidisphaeraceae bacterium]